MRRPVKPFVTEYKGSNRRPNAPAGRALSEDFYFAGATSEAPPRTNGDSGTRNSEDAYEAALRAADALFAPAVKTASPQPASVASLDGDSDVADAEPGSGLSGGGRILRAIDEQRDDGLADLEAARAPKKRGRKPGSKNKVKVAPPMAPPGVPQRSEVSLPVSFSRAPAMHAPSAESGQLKVSSTPAPPASRPSLTLYRRSSSQDRFPWIRTKLKPGEAWKKRLPKICW